MLVAVAGGGLVTVAGLGLEPLGLGLLAVGLGAGLGGPGLGLAGVRLPLLQAGRLGGGLLAQLAGARAVPLPASACWTPPRRRR